MRANFKKFNYAIFLIVSIALINTSCKKKDDDNVGSGGSSQIGKVQTLQPTNIDFYSATLNANITNAGNPKYVEKGFVFSEDPSPNAYYSQKITATGSGTGKYNCKVSDLDEGTKYYVRAYIYIDEEVNYIYGNQMEFLTLTDPVFVNPFVITATNVIGCPSEIVTVKAFLPDFVNDKWAEIASTKYENNGFSLKLPSPLNNKYLEVVTEFFWFGTISNPSAKMTVLDYIPGYDKYDDYIGAFGLYENKVETWHYTLWIYTNKDVNINGEFEYEDYDYSFKISADLTLKKGWNILYESDTEIYNSTTEKWEETIKLSTQKPSGVNYLWYLGDGYCKSPKKSKDSNEKNSLLLKLKDGGKKNNIFAK